MKTNKNLRDKRFLTDKDVSLVLELSRQKVKQMFRDDTIRGFKVGKKSWRTTWAYVDAYITRCQEADLNNGGITDETKSKFRFHAGLRVVANAPQQIERSDAIVQDLKEKIPAADPLARVPKIAKLKSVVETREEKRQKLENIPAQLNDLSETAYPGMMDLTEEDPEALEARFVAEANEALNAQGVEQAAGPMNQYHQDSIGANVPAAKTATANAKTAESE